MDALRKGKSMQPQTPMPTGGLEPPTETPMIVADSESGGAESGAVGAQSGPFDPDQAAVNDAWPHLPDAVKARILAIVNAAR